jgi:histidinol-phosphate aminotransferase
MEKYFKRAVVQLAGYASPPQEVMRAKLNQNESPFDLPELFKKAVLDEALTMSWNRYPFNDSPELKAALAKWHNLRAEQVLLGNGSNQLLQTLLSAVIEPGEKVLYFPPTFGLFELFTTIYGGGQLAMLQSPEKPFDLQQVLAVIKSEAPKLILLCSPNNPTGQENSLAEIESICEIAPGLVFLDEAYGEFSDQNAIPLLKKYPQLIISRTFSKAFSMAGLRLGYILSSQQNIEQLRKANLPYNVNLLTERIALRLLADLSIMEKQTGFIKKERDWLKHEMRQIPNITVYPSAANFILFRCQDGKAVFRRLKEQGILVRDVSGYPLLSNHLRVSVGQHQENEWFLEALQKSLA